jgi:hypothetical protein
MRSKTSRERVLWKTLPVLWRRRKRSQWWTSSAHCYGTHILRSRYRASGTSFALPAASQGVPTFWPPPAQIRPCHLLLESPVLARAGRPRRGGFTCHGMRADVVSRTMGNRSTSARSARGGPGLTHDRSGFQPFPVPCPGAPHWWTVRLG